MSRLSQFTFEAYQLDKKSNTLHFYYSYNKDLKFQESLFLGGKKIAWNRINLQALDRIIFNLHLVLGLSYYKLYCPKKIVIKSGQLSQNEAKFWDKLYTKGLGELFYRNQIDYRGLINFPSTKITSASQKLDLEDRCLLANGGGKDSVVAAEKLKELKHSFSILSLNDSDIQRATSQIIGAKRIIIRRTLDPKIDSLPDVYRGHIPISSIFAWVATLSAILYNYKHLVFANEASANFGNLKYLGEEINHQYSKSLEFENDFRDYLTNFISPDINYFSLLRNLSELKITGEFSRYPQYFAAFSSCNRNFSQTRKIKNGYWCGECAKCAFMFSQLAAHLPKKQLLKIFGQNLFAKDSLLPTFQELWGEKRFKPFDCVGTPDEVRAAFLLAGQNKSWNNDLIMNYFNSKIKNKIKDGDKLISQALKNNFDHNIPENFRKILILGYGQEGKATHKYLRKKYPYLQLAIADQNPITTDDKKVTVHQGAKYLNHLQDYDLIIKTQGISDLIPELQGAHQAGIEFTSITNIFLRQYSEQTIGVTGTKGKSTTASLIYAIFKEADKSVHLVGNIGNDSVKYLLTPQDKQTIFIDELSSYQLASADRSPHVAVFINIFPDHMPYHGGYQEYIQAKANINRYQTKSDFLFYNPGFKALKKLAQKSLAKNIDYLQATSVKNGAIYYGQEIIINLADIKLLGDHNVQNIRAAISVAKLYNIKNASIKKAITNFSNLKHRLQFVGKYQKIDFYDDAISTTPESTLAAINVFKERLGAIILGGEDRGYNFTILIKKILKLNLQAIVLLPDSGLKIAQEIKKIAGQKKLPKMLITKNMDQAVKFIYQNTAAGKVGLLSTASPSYSLFKNFQEKGNLFQAAVKKYSKSL